jgi:hypothetical protein
MTPVEFIAQLNELRRRVRRVFLVGAGVVVLVDLWIILYVLQLYPLAVQSDDALVAHSIGALACLPALVALLLVVRRTVDKYAPLCRTCGTKALWSKRSEILTTGHCPSCLAAFFTVPPRPQARTSTAPTPPAS